MTPHPRYDSAPHLRRAAPLLTCLLLTACSSADPPTQTPPVTDPHSVHAEYARQVTYRWTAEPGIDLDSPEVQVARAFTESQDAWGRTEDHLSVYPGYPGKTYQGISVHIPPRIGTTYLHIYGVEPITDDNGDPATRVTVCYDKSTRAIEETPGTWVPAETGFNVAVIVTRDDRTQPVRPELDHTRRLPYPTWDVFAGWNAHWATGRHRSEATVTRTRCALEMKHFNPDRRSTPIPPPVEPFHPGWPVAVDTPADHQPR